MRSMTGCGRGAASDAVWQVSAEVRSVNHRFLDVACRLPRNLSFLEDVVRKALSAQLKRGHVDVYITVTRLSGGSNEAKVDTALAASLAQAAAAMQQETGLPLGLTVGSLMQMEGVLSVQEAAMDEEAVSALCAQAMTEAVNALVEMRIREGRAMRDDLQSYLTHAQGLYAEIAALAPTVVETYRERLSQRLAQLPIEPVEPQRLAQEVALMADKCAIDEELARLQTHFNQLSQWLTDDGAGEAGISGEIGKKLDFLIQEMNRETNTIGSKANHTGITMAVVSLKSDIEKLREQAANIE